MSDKETLDQLADRLEEATTFFHGIYLKHNTTGGHYIVTGFSFLEATMTLTFTYAPLSHQHVRFTRPMQELTDGRFTLSRIHPNDRGKIP